MNFEELLLEESRHWRAFLHVNQYYLGRSYVWVKGEGVTDLLDITPDERNDLFGISKTIKKALSELFHPDLFNYASSGNITNHLHWHIIPRYQSPQEFDGLIFRDENWRKNYVPDNYDFRIPDKTLIKIRNAIRGQLTK